MPYAASDNSNIMLPVASHMHSSYSSFHHFNPGAGYPPHTAIRYQPDAMPTNNFHQPPPPPNYKPELHDPHSSPSMMSHNQLINPTSLPSVPVSSQPALNSINSLNNGSNNNGNNVNDYHMPSHHMQQQQQQHQQQQQQQQQQHHHQSNSQNTNNNNNNSSNTSNYHHSPPLEHAQQPNQDVSSYSSTVTPVSMPSPPASLPPASPLRFDIMLDAPTAAAQRIDETPMTYLNKGQYYSIIMQDQEKYDSELTSIVKVMFNDDTHRKTASTYWSFWLTQQSSPKSARAIDIDKAASTGISNVETKAFDRVQFKWNGKKGAKIFVRFNCLSTDFSRIKGVKGIPLRVHVETKSDSGTSTTTNTLEKSFAKVKLFRDKGAERKNKDDQKHLEKMCEKMRGKTQETTPMIMMYAPPNPVTSFTDISNSNDSSDDDDVLSLSESLNNLDPEVEGGELMTLQLGKRRRFSMGSEFLEPLDRDPTYIPHIRKRRAVLCIYVKLPGETSYRAVYLNHLTVQDLISKLSDKLDFSNQQIADVIRYSKSRNLTVRVDDEYINQIEDEQDMEVEVQIGQDGSMMILTLKY